MERGLDKQSSFLSPKRVLIITKVPQDEIKSPTFGGSRLVKELYKQIVMKGFQVYLSSVFDLNTLSARLLRIKGEKTSRLGIRLFLKIDRLRWFLSLLNSLVAEIASRIDVKLQKEIEMKMNEIKPDVILYNGSIGAFAFLRVAKRRNIPFIVLEHNVDYYFYKDKLGCYHPLISIYKVIELTACKAADLIICFNPYDRERLAKDGVSSEKIIVWKFNVRAEKGCDKEKVLNSIPSDIRRYVENNFVVGFLGSNYTPNIVAVKYILKIAEKLPKDIVFLIMGSVAEVFKGTKTPSNVIFTGYIKNVKPYLAVTDVFLNLKFTSDTGIEAKMFDYLSCGKPIISTRIGAVGFEHSPNVIIVNNLRDAVREIIRLYKEWRAKIKYRTYELVLVSIHGEDL